MLGNQQLMDKIDNARTMNMYYNGELKNQWYYFEKEFLNELGIVGSSKIITKGEADVLYND